MEEQKITAQELTEVLLAKGYNNRHLFVGKGFDFFDSMSAGLSRVGQTLAREEAPSGFNITWFPVWNGENKPYALSTLNCEHYGDSISIREHDLTFYNGYGVLLDEKPQIKPKIEEIPDRVEVQKRLRELTQPVNHRQDRSRNRKGRKM